MQTALCINNLVDLWYAYDMSVVDMCLKMLTGEFFIYNGLYDKNGVHLCGNGKWVVYEIIGH